MPEIVTWTRWSEGAGALIWHARYDDQDQKDWKIGWGDSEESAIHDLQFTFPWLPPTDGLTGC